MPYAPSCLSPKNFLGSLPLISMVADNYVSSTLPGSTPRKMATTPGGRLNV